jgi:hypothetical protein
MKNKMIIIDRVDRLTDKYGERGNLQQEKIENEFEEFIIGVWMQESLKKKEDS